MCGICGVLNFSGEEVSPLLLRKMTDSIAHRGPDGEGWYRDKSVGLGHRRLAILDLSPAAHQPMITRDGRYALSYNGEIYNFPELRTELQSRGHIFRSSSDTEIVLSAWAEWGPESVSRLNGIFAFAIWDSLDERLFLCRDRYGAKPLYVFSGTKSLVFGSEIKAVLVHPAVTTDIDKKALLEYLTFQNYFTSRTLMKGISLVPPGTIVTVDCRTQIQTSHQYWDFQFGSDGVDLDPREWEEELDRLLRQAVSRQLISDVQLGSYLSGGMDSGTLTALASREMPNLKTFTCGFDLSSASGFELGFDERTKAEAMSALFKTEHYEMVLKSGDMERCMRRLVWHMEEPRVGQSYPNFYAAGLASKFVKVVLSGVGGDELFAGYPWRYYRAAGSKSFDDYVDDYYQYWQRLVDNRYLQKMFGPIRQETEDVWTRDIFREVFASHDIELSTSQDYVNHSLYFEAKTFLHGLLVVEDKLSMAHGLETRVPFLDNDLVDFAARCPVTLKLRNLDSTQRLNENEPDATREHFKITSDGKQILRKVMSRYIPASVTTGPKQGFSSPDASWFKGESVDFVRSKLLSKNSRIYEFLEHQTTSELIKDHLDGRENRRLLIWSLLCVETFLDVFV